MWVRYHTTRFQISQELIGFFMQGKYLTYDAPESSEKDTSWIKYKIRVLKSIKDCKPRSARFDFFLKPHALQKSLINHDILQEIARVVDSLGREHHRRVASNPATTPHRINNWYRNWNENENIKSSRFPVIKMFNNEPVTRWIHDQTK